MPLRVNAFSKFETSQFSPGTSKNTEGALNMSKDPLYIVAVEKTIFPGAKGACGERATSISGFSRYSSSSQKA